MAEIIHTPEEVDQFFAKFGGKVCKDSEAFCKEKGIWGLSPRDGLAALEAAGETKWADYLRKIINSPEYVKYNGKVITMGTTYQVFDPLTASHAEYPNEEAARAAVIEISTRILEHYQVNVLQSMSNENGDTAWAPSNLSTPLVIS